MDGFTGYPVKTFRPGAYQGRLSFQTNGSSSPAATTHKGSLKGKCTIVYTATGIFTVTLSAGMAFPETPVILVTSQCADNTNTNQFWVTQTGEWNNTARSFVIQANQGTTAFAPPATAGNRINFEIGIINSTGL
jgi:hypothetical protein